MPDELDALYARQEKKAQPPGQQSPSESADGEEDVAPRRNRLITGAIGVGMVAMGGGLGWLFSRSKRRQRTEALVDRVRPNLDIGVDEYFETDPRLLRYDLDQVFDPGLKFVRRVSVDHKDRVYVCGDDRLKIFDADGGLRAEIQPEGLPHCVAVREDGQIFAAVGSRIMTFTEDGKPIAQWDDRGTQSYVTALALSKDELFAADARQREVIRFDHDGRELGRFGKKDPTRNNPGMVVPSPYFDLLLGGDGLLLVINPGRHRVERYTREGTFQSAWGVPGIKTDGFCGCCNPVYMTLLPDGRIITSEKGILRVKIHAVDGSVEGLVAGPESFMSGDGGKQAKSNFRLNKGMDVAADSKGRVLVADPYSQRIRIFKPKAG